MQICYNNNNNNNNMYSRNIKGPKTVHWGTLDFTWAFPDVSPSTATQCRRCVSQALIHSSILPFIPQCSNFRRSRMCGTTSKALLKSTINMSTCSLLSRCLAISSIVVTN